MDHLSYQILGRVNKPLVNEKKFLFLSPTEISAIAQIKHYTEKEPIILKKNV